MSHTIWHTIISRAREAIASWPLSAVSGGTALGALVGWLF